MSATDPLLGGAIRHAHGELLATLREFVATWDSGDEPPPASDMSAVVAFLRHGVLHFARREESWLGPHAAESDGTAFEHAFLAAETDALAREAAGLARTHPRERPSRDAAARAVRRRLHRIEAILELHVRKAEDRDASTSAIPTNDRR